MTRDSIQIRPAQPADAEVAAALLYSAYTHTVVTYPLPVADETRWVEHLRRYFPRAGNRFSYQNACVATHEAEVVGLVLSFGGRDETRLNAAVSGWLEREAQDDEWYIDALAVFTHWGRQGIGARLMGAAEEQARQHGYLRIALHIAAGNTRAEHLYTRLGYEITQRILLYQRPHIRMEKRLQRREP